MNEASATIAEMHPAYAQAPLRPADQVMRLARMGAFFPTRLSFMRALMRQLALEGAEATRPLWQMDASGFGTAIYQISLSGHIYSLIAFSNAIPEDKRTDRVIAEMWDSAFILFDGIPTKADLERLQYHAPRQEAGRFLPSELILSRANKSLRLFNHCVERLAEGRQPDHAMVRDIGYLMRTTAVYGNGKFGIADRAHFAARPGLENPFRLEMLTVWLIRAFTHDLVDHVAKARAPQKAVALAPAIKRYLGIGNATGLGMAPFLVNHPVLLNNWMMVRETALARILAQNATTTEIATKSRALAARSAQHLAEWNVDDSRQMQRIIQLRSEWQIIIAKLQGDFLAQSLPWQKLLAIGTDLSLECQELLLALILEPHGDLIDGLTDCMGASHNLRLNPAMSCGQILAEIKTHCAWALDIDFEDPRQTQHFWYVSEEKLEPRLGNRHEEMGADKEQPLDIARQIQHLAADCAQMPAESTMATFLMAYPQHRNIAKRVQAAAQFPYAEIRDNLIGDQCLPIDMLRCKLSFFGAAKFDPKSDRWTRIALFQGAPLIHDLAEDADDWWLPVLGDTQEPVA